MSNVIDALEENPTSHRGAEEAVLEELDQAEMVDGHKHVAGTVKEADADADVNYSHAESTGGMAYSGTQDKKGHYIISTAMPEATSSTSGNASK